MKVPSKILKLLVLPVTFLAFTPTFAYAEELLISGNGSSSVNEVNVTSNNTSSVVQNNNTGVTNIVNANTNTGGNSASENTGNNITTDTGNSQVEVAVVNSVNSSTVEGQGCCGIVVNAGVSGNGENSQNNVTVNQLISNLVIQSNNAFVVNNVNINAYTGNNSANENSGNVNIQTGNVKVQGAIVNQNVNISHVNNESGGFSLSALISGNGSGSVNSLTANFSNNSSVNVNNVSNIYNNLDVNADSGNNTANGNLGNVSIKTGDVFIGAIISNTTNHNLVDIDCCDFDPNDPDDPGEPSVPPTSNDSPKGGSVGGTTNGGSSGGGSTSVGSVLAAAIGGITLPATGSNAILLATIANVIMFLMGLYLRLRSGRSPAKVILTLQFCL